MTPKPKYQPRFTYAVPSDELFKVELPESIVPRINRAAKNERDSKKRAREESRNDNLYWN